MIKQLTIALLSVACLPIFGCAPSSSSPQGQVAVVDLDEIARQLGKDKEILQLIEKRQITLNEQVNATQKSLIQQLNQKKSEFGELSEEETQQLARLQAQANSILASTRNQAQSNLTAYQQEVIDRFRAEAKPIALELATKKGFRVVLSKNDSVVFTFDQTVDLTSEVAAYLKTKEPTKPASEIATRRVSEDTVDRLSEPKAEVAHAAN